MSVGCRLRMRGIWGCCWMGGSWGLQGCMGVRFRLSQLGDGVRLPFVEVADGGGFGVSVGMGFRGRHGGNAVFRGERAGVFRAIERAMAGRGAGYAALVGRAMGGMGYWAWVIFIGLGRHWLALDGNTGLGGFVFRGAVGGWAVWGCWGAWVCGFASHGWGMGLGCRLLGVADGGGFVFCTIVRPGAVWVCGWCRNGVRGWLGEMSFSMGKGWRFPLHRVGIGRFGCWVWVWFS